MPAVLVETNFITNRSEERLLARDDFRERVATAIADGIAAFLSAKNAGAAP
jgi:N-acetylmuramoyl-L-alanine amidase